MLKYQIFIFIRMSLQDYELLGKLGAGSFGVVHKARDSKTNTIVVLKIVDVSKMNTKLRKNVEAYFYVGNG